MSIDTPISFVETAGLALAKELKDKCAPQVVVTAATLGIPVGIAVAKGLGLDQIVVLQKTNKIHLKDALLEPLKSITTSDAQMLRLDRAQIPNIQGRRVVFVDDVISTGGSVKAALRLIRQAKGEVVGIGAVLVEGSSWKETIGKDDASLVHWLDKIPLFRKTDQGWKADWE
uniref:Phosphoribosyltransferase domain-containing protein n=1 Tax=Amphora coffeiformis TaxID=265554 RepID=A0A7S3L7L0_9STRA